MQSPFTRTSSTPQTASLRSALAERWIPWLLIIATLIAMGGVVTHGFGPVDDVLTISQNPKLNPPRFTADSVLWYWTHPHMNLYIPVTYTVWGLLAKATWVETPDEQGLFLDAHVFHAASLLMHLVSVLAVYALLRRLLNRAWPAAAGALLFGLHPLQVETIAWTSGLKDVMFGAFSLIALWCYVSAATQDDPVGSASADGTAPRARAFNQQKLTLAYAEVAWRRSFYVGGLFSLLIALLCKPTAMVAPFVAIVLDHFILRRPLRQIIRSVAPWIAIVLPLAVVAKLVQSGSGIATPPLWQRPVVAGGSLAFYLGKLLLPINLTFDYGWKPLELLRHRWFWGIALVPVALGAWLVTQRRRRPWLVAAALVPVVALLPILGFVPFMFQFFSTVADHYVYLAMLGPAMALAWGLTRVPDIHWRSATVGSIVGALLLAAVTVHQMRYWKDEQTTLVRVLAVNPNNLLGHTAMGKYHQNRRQFEAAVKEYRTATSIDPTYLAPREALVNIYSYLGRADEAIEQMHALMDIHAKLPAEYRQDYSGAFFEVGQLTLSQGRYADAARYFTEALRLKPDRAEAKIGLERAQEKLRAASTKPSG